MFTLCLLGNLCIPGNPRIEKRTSVCLWHSQAGQGQRMFVWVTEASNCDVRVAISTLDRCMVGLVHWALDYRGKWLLPTREAESLAHIQGMLFLLKGQRAICAPASEFFRFVQTWGEHSGWHQWMRSQYSKCCGRKSNPLEVRGICVWVWGWLPCGQRHAVSLGILRSSDLTFTQTQNSKRLNICRWSLLQAVTCRRLVRLAYSN